MLFLDKWERKFGWLSFPGLLKYYALFHVLVYLLQIVNPSIGEILDFNRAKIMNGEVWRAFTFLFADSGSGGLGAFGALFLFFMVMIAIMMNDSLEGAWGAFRTSIFHYTAFVGLILANFLYPVPMPSSGFFVYSSAFFAFATLFPKHEFMMFLIIPVQVRWLAILFGALLIIGIFPNPIYFGFLLLGFANYLLWAGIPALRGQARVVKSVARKRQFDKHKLNDGEAFHRCKVCGRTELSDPELEFRMAGDGEEYCVDHLPE